MFIFMLLVSILSMTLSLYQIYIWCTTFILFNFIKLLVMLILGYRINFSHYCFGRNKKMRHWNIGLLKQVKLVKWKRYYAPNESNSFLSMTLYYILIIIWMLNLGISCNFFLSFWSIIFFYKIFIYTKF